MTLSERDITAQILDYLRLRGGWVFKVHGHLGQMPGVADLLCCFRGRFLAIEIKIRQPLNTKRQIERFLHPAQRRQLEAIVRAGGKALVVTDVADVMAALEQA
jgi:hypothetical protein